MFFFSAKNINIISEFNEHNKTVVLLHIFKSVNFKICENKEAPTLSLNIVYLKEKAERIFQSNQQNEGRISL